MNQSNPDFEMSEMPLPPEPPPEEEPTNEIWSWAAIKEFPSWEEACKWACEMRTNGGPKYLVRKMDKDYWEAIQAWMRIF